MLARAPTEQKFRDRPVSIIVTSFPCRRPTNDLELVVVTVPNNVAASICEPPHDVEVTSRRGPVHRVRVVAFFADVDVEPSFEQEIYGRQVSRKGRQMQQRVLVRLVADVEFFRMLVEQGSQRANVTVFRGVEDLAVQRLRSLFGQESPSFFRKGDEPFHADRRFYITSCSAVRLTIIVLSHTIPHSDRGCTSHLAEILADVSELDSLFHEAVTAIDGGDLTTLERLLSEHPRLLRDRLDAPGPWLRDKVGGALKGFFKKPYLLWFVAEDPVRNGTLPPNISLITRAIIEAAQRNHIASLQEQLDYALQLVSWSWIARQCGVQIGLIDALVDAGASPHGNPENALVNANFAAAEHLLERGATLSLATALCLGRWDDVTLLANSSKPKEKQFGFVLAALNGKPEALRRMIDFGVDVNKPSENLYSHGTPLHHAVCSGSREAVEVLVDAGARLNAVDKVWKATPLGWAEHYVNQHKRDERTKAYAEIADYLRHKGATE